ncbi:hypothetical protein QFZ87_001016 [Bacillus sp. SLBN-46]|nr:hypothetical protein [Bacillus sp. SLBN-46]
MKFFAHNPVAQPVSMNFSLAKHEDSHVKRMNDCTYARSFFFLYLNYTNRVGVKQ